MLSLLDWHNISKLSELCDIRGIQSQLGLAVRQCSSASVTAEAMHGNAILAHYVLSADELDPHVIQTQMLHCPAVYSLANAKQVVIL